MLSYKDWNVLKTVYDNMLKYYDKENKDFVDDLYPGVFLSKGMNGDDIRKLQRFLLKICQYDHSIPGVKVNGEFDDLTERSVKKIQDDYNLGITGIVGPFSWRKIVELANR